MAKRTCLEPNCPLPVISRRGLCRPHHEAEVAGPDKRCSKCNERKLKAEFSPVKRNKDGRHSWCKACCRALANASYDPVKAAAKHQDNQKDLAYRAMKKTAYDRWRAEHPDRAREATVRWRKANAEHVADMDRRWRESNAEVVRWYRRNDKARRRARMRETQVGKVDYRLILERDGMVCHICKGDIPGLDDLHMDHVIPLSRGGTHTMDNIKPSHEWCNLSKHAKLMEELNL